MDIRNISNNNYFNNLINKIVEKRDFEKLSKKDYNNNNLDNLTDVFEKANNDDFLSKSISIFGKEFIELIENLLKNNVDDKTLTDILNKLSNNDDILFTRTDSNDPYITYNNKIDLKGADISKFLVQSNDILSKNNSLTNYLNTVNNISSNCDYDDLRRFMEVVDYFILKDNNLDKLCNLSDKVISKNKDKFEFVLFALQVFDRYNTNLDKGLEVINKIYSQSNDFKNDINKLVLFMIEKGKNNISLDSFINRILNSDNSIKELDNILSENGFKLTTVKNRKFKRIEGITGSEDIIIKRGEKVALYAQAISDTEGVLPASVLYWSSLQKGSIKQGTNFLDLSKLDVGTHDIYVKVGPGISDGTDTAKRRVIVLENDEPIDQEYYDYEEDDENFIFNNQDKLSSFKEMLEKLFAENYYEIFSEEDEDLHKKLNDCKNIKLQDPNKYWEKILEIITENTEIYIKINKEFKKFLEKKVLQDKQIEKVKNEEETKKENLKNKIIINDNLLNQNILL